MEQLSNFHNLLLVVITGITLFVLALMIYVIVRFNEKRNPEPTKTTHNTLVEVLWTVVPVIILVAIAIPSFKLLRSEEHTSELQSLMRTSYDVFCLKTQKKQT